MGELARAPGVRSSTHWTVIRAPSRTGWVEASPKGRRILLQPDLGHRNWAGPCLPNQLHTNQSRRELEQKEQAGVAWATSECVPRAPGKTGCPVLIGSASRRRGRLPRAEGGAESPTSLPTSRLALSLAEGGVEGSTWNCGRLRFRRLHASSCPVVWCPHARGLRRLGLTLPVSRDVALRLLVRRPTLLAWPPLLSFDECLRGIFSIFFTCFPR